MPSGVGELARCRRHFGGRETRRAHALRRSFRSHVLAATKRPLCGTRGTRPSGLQTRRYRFRHKIVSAPYARRVPLKDAALVELALASLFLSRRRCCQRAPRMLHHRFAMADGCGTRAGAWQRLINARSREKAQHFRVSQLLASCVRGTYFRYSRALGL